MSQGTVKLTYVFPSIDVLAARQLGLVTAQQLRQIGLSDSQIRTLVSKSRLSPMRRGVYRVAGAPSSWEQVVLAAALAAGDGAAISHGTAAAVWELRHSNRFAAGIHITAGHQVRLNGVVGHRSPLSLGERVTYRAIPVTSPERTIVDLAATMKIARLGSCVDDALRRRLIRLDQLRLLIPDANSAGAGRRRVVPVQQVLADRLGDFRPGDSDWEQEMDRQWDRLGLPSARRQYRVTANGRTYKLDRAIPDLKIGVEWNGFEVHGRRSSFDGDSDRAADLAAEGWHLISFTSNSAPERIARAVFRIVGDRQSRFGLLVAMSR